MKSLPQEVEVWHVIPAIRSEFAKEMMKQGMKQVEIAKKLNVTRAAISQYISGKRASDVKFDAEVKKIIKKAAKRVIEGSSPVREIDSICSLFRKKGCLCKVHRKMDKSLTKCGVCLS